MSSISCAFNWAVQLSPTAYPPATKEINISWLLAWAATVSNVPPGQQRMTKWEGATSSVCHSVSLERPWGLPGPQAKPTSNRLCYRPLSCSATCCE